MEGLQNRPVERGVSPPAAKLQPCPHCGAAISPNAKDCPKCGKAISPADYAPCRTCGKLLEKGLHYYKKAIRSTINGSSELQFYWRHDRCPNCGDPKPLNALEGKRLLRNTIITVILFFVAYGGWSTAWHLDYATQGFVFRPLDVMFMIAAGIAFLRYLLKYIFWFSASLINAAKTS